MTKILRLLESSKADGPMLELTFSCPVPGESRGTFIGPWLGSQTHTKRLTLSSTHPYLSAMGKGARRWFRPHILPDVLKHQVERPSFIVLLVFWFMVS